MSRLPFCRFLVLLLYSASAFGTRAALPDTGIFSQTNLVAWCIVPFDTKKRDPETRAAMLETLGIHRLAYDWRSEHIPTFDAEVAAMARHKVELTAWWFPAALNAEARAILDCLKRHQLRPQLWVTMGTEPETDPDRLNRKIADAVQLLGGICEEAAKLGSTVGLYNHMGWFGEPENQLRILEGLRAAGHTNAGIVYNFHHGHTHIDRFPVLLKAMQPHLLAINLNGMVREGDKLGRKIIPLGNGDLELDMLRTIRASGWKGPIGILGHTEEDAEVKLRKELAGLNKLAPQLDAPPRAVGEPAISGRDPGVQGENDWVDSRWQQTDVGPALASVLATPGGVIAKGFSIRVGAEGSNGVAYDTTSGALRAAWTGGFLLFSPSRYGLTDAPRIQGAVQMAFRNTPAWLGTGFHFNGHHRNGTRILLDLDLDGTRVLESPWMTNRGSIALFSRTLWMAPTHRALTPVLAHPVSGIVADSFRVRATTSGSVAEFGGEKERWIVAIHGTSEPPQLDAEGRVVLPLRAEASARRLQITLWQGSASQLDDARAAVEALAWDAAALEATRSWPQATAAPTVELTTQGQRDADREFLSVDTLTAPYDNPFKALLFFAGVDLTSDQTLYACTIHGDVWQVTGVDDALKTLHWKRFATGLFQPLGLKVRDGAVYVLGRDRITRLRDINQDGVADSYESFCDRMETSTEGHDYVTSLETDIAGNFYYVDPKGVHRVTPDGRTMETIATGWRNPNGMGVSPDGKMLTVAPQQGTWTPSSLISEVKPGGYYGYGGPKVSPTRPGGYDPQLCWIPHSVDNSSGSQVWIPEGTWGTLGGHFLHLLWGRSGVMMVLRDTTAAVTQGAVVPLPAKFQSGPNRATFNPRDGALYVAGSTGWQTNARKDGSLHRVRYNAKPVALPAGFRTEADALILEFNQPLERSTAEDTGSYGIRQWNYHYSQDYGSRDWSVKDPTREGRDEVEIKSARLLPDGHSVRLEIPGLKPVMQMEVKYNLDGTGPVKSVRGQFWLTLNAVGPRPVQQ